MKHHFPPVFYHSISQKNLSNAMALKLDVVPGLSRFHLDAEGKNPGLWLSDDLGMVVEGGYGNEQSEEIIGELNIGDETIQVKKPIMSIVLRIEGLDERQILQHPLFPDQFFFTGDIPWVNVKKFLVRDHDEDAEKIARETAARLKQEFGVEIEVGTFNPFVGFERKWGKPELESQIPDPFRKQKRYSQENIIQKDWERKKNS